MEYLFAVLIPIVAVAIIVIIAKRIASHTFKCKHCSNEFNIKWSKVSRPLTVFLCFAMEKLLCKC